MKRKSDYDESSSPKKAKKQPKLVFPADLWARIVEHLPYSNVLPLSATAPFFKKEVFPLVKTLFIDKREQMIGVHARRFQSAKSIFLLICSFPEYEIPDVKSHHVAPFLQAFPELKYVFLGRIKSAVPHPTKRKQAHSAVTEVCHCPLEPMPSCGFFDNDYFQLDDILAMIRSICAFLSFGWISSDVHFEGLLDDFGCNIDASDYYDTHTCEHCKEICTSYPLDQLMRHMHKLCLSQETRLSIISKRKGGIEALAQDSFPELLSEVSPGNLGEDSRGEFFTKIFELIERGLKPSKIPHDKLLLALFRDPKNPKHALPVQERRLYKEDFDLLVHLGFHLHEEDLTINWDAAESVSAARPASCSRLHDADDSLDGLEEVSQPSNKKPVEDDSMVVFPTEVWSRMMEYLPFSDVLPMSVVCSFFLQDVFPLVKALFIDKKRYLIPAHANRFPGAQSVFILCIDQSNEVDDLTSIQATPFLQIFPKLKYFFIGNMKKNEKHPTEREQEHSPVTEVCHCPLNPILYVEEGCDDTCREFRPAGKLLLSIGAAMDFGHLSSYLVSGGLFGNFCCVECWRDFNNAGRCQLCETVCREFPVDLVASSLYNKLCIPHDMRFQIVSHRPGDLEALTEAGLLPFLSRASSMMEDVSCYPYAYSVPTNAFRHLMATGLKPQDVNRKDMLRTMFAWGDDEEPVDVENRWMDLNTFHQLQELGFPLRREDISEGAWEQGDGDD